MKTLADHALTCAYYGDSMMPCTCGADPNIVGCHYDASGRLQTNERKPRVIQRTMTDGISTKDGMA